MTTDPLKLKTPQTMRMGLSADVLAATIAQIYVNRVNFRPATVVPSDGTNMFSTSNIRIACRRAENNMKFYRDTADPGTPEHKMLVSVVLPILNNSLDKFTPVHGVECAVNWMDQP
mgnify:CR=1 FL=1